MSKIENSNSQFLAMIQVKNTERAPLSMYALRTSPGTEDRTIAKGK